MSTIRITVLRKMCNVDLFDEYGQNLTPECDLVPDNAVFISQDYYMPEGFCPWAWADIHREVIALAMGANYPWSKQEGVVIACCTDGLRPVIFKLERLE
jgi:uncharacterized repeat protein (TIGR04076 family)